MKSVFASLLLVTAVLLGSSAPSLAARLVAKVDLSSQTMVVTKDGRVLHRWKISSGREGFRTPTGTYSAKRMHKMWYSRKYDMSPMPYSIFFRGGYAIHGTNYVSRLGRPASHGCIRLHTDNARRLYELTQQVGAGNMRVSISY